MTALVSLSTGGAITGFSLVPGAAAADLTSPTGTQVRLLALHQSARPAQADDAMLRSAIVNVANYYLRMAQSKTPAAMEALIWQHDSIDGVDHGESCAAFASLTLELAAQVVGQQSWVTGGTSYPWPLHKWADVRVDPNPASPGITSVVQDAQAHHRWHPLGDGYQPLPGDWVLFAGHVEVVTNHSDGVLQTVGGDSLPNLTVNAHQFPDPLSAQGVTGFVNNGELTGTAGQAQASNAQTARVHRTGHHHQAGPGMAAIPGTGTSTAATTATARPAKVRDRPRMPREHTSPASQPPAVAASTRESKTPASQLQAHLQEAQVPGTGASGPAAAPRSAMRGAAAIPGLSITARRLPDRAQHQPRAGYIRHQPTAAITPAPGSSSQQAFIRAVAAGAMATQRKYGVPAAVTIAQAIDESAWGQSYLSATDHNLFGIKGAGPAGSDMQPTQEYQNGQYVSIIASFRMYHDVAQSIDDHGKLLATSGYYTQAMTQRHDPNAFANALTGVYATDPGYGAKLISLMQQYHLYQYDAAAQGSSHAPAAAGKATRPGHGGVTIPGTGGAPTPGPTGTPSPEPSGAPSPGPTGTPTPGPTGTPTPGPSGTPTPGPTGTGKPTSGPTGTPTPDPSGTPSPAPTGTTTSRPSGTTRRGTTGTTVSGPTGTGTSGPAGATGSGPTATATSRPSGTTRRGVTGNTVSGPTGTTSHRPSGATSHGPTGTGSSGPTWGTTPGPTRATPSGPNGTGSSGSPGTTTSGPTGTGNSGQTGAATSGSAGAPGWGPTGSPTSGATAVTGPGRSRTTSGGTSAGGGRGAAGASVHRRYVLSRSGRRRPFVGGSGSVPSTGAGGIASAGPGGVDGSAPGEPAGPAPRGPAPAGSARGGAAIPGVSPLAPAPPAAPSQPSPATGAAAGGDSDFEAARLLSYSAPSPQDWSARPLGTPGSGRAQRITVRTSRARASQYQHHLPPAVKNAFLASARGPLTRAEAMYRDVASHSGIRWELLAACDWMQCRAKRRYSPVHGEKLGTVNADGTAYRTKSAALEQCADDLVELAGAVYQIDLTAAGYLSVRDLANAFAAFRWGGLLKLHRTSAMEFPYSVEGLTDQHIHMRWPNIDEPLAPDKPGGRFHQPFGAVPIVLGLDYPAVIE